MNLKPLAALVTSKAGRQMLKLQKHSPHILFVTGVVGVVGTAVLASRATLKLHDVIDEVQKNLSDRDTLVEQGREDYSKEDAARDTVLIYAKASLQVTKLYAPALLVGAASVACLTGSHIILNRRNIALTAAYAALDKGFRAYRDRVLWELGDEKDREFRFGKEEDEEVVETQPDGTEVRKAVKKLKDVGQADRSIYARMFTQGASPSWEPIPMKNQFFIQCQQHYANDMLRARGHLFLNEVYDMLGLERSQAGSIVGWIYNPDNKKHYGDNYVDFGVFEGNRHDGMRFVRGDSDSILLDFNVDGVIWDKI